MRWFGKVAGALIGVLIAGPIGLLIGLGLGHLYDAGLFRQFLGGASAGGQSKVQQLFFDSTFAIMGFIAKSDGRVSEQEIAAARNVMAQMNLNEDMKREAIAQFTKGKQPDFNVQTTLNELKAACWVHPSLLQTFLEIQIYMAHVEGPLTAKKREAIQFICQTLGVSGFNFDQFEHQYQNQQQRQQTRYNPQQHLQAAYAMLGIQSSASDSEIKKAYRRMMSKNHPDKLIAKGVPQEMIKLATQKTQQIKRAYETIKDARGIG